ncbi:MAG: HDOD domain-containing protein [Campylobacterota bacterium]|nr:HDOD domain-containing protein [Campylobacterota bacterium]
MNFRSIVKNIESLPPLSDTTLIVRELYMHGAENIDISRLVRSIEKDALLTANILRMINSPFYGMSKQISSVSQAVTLFGTHIIYGLVVRFSIESAIIANVRPYCISNTNFNKMCHMQSALMNEWYSQIDIKHAQILSPLALIMEAGKLVVSQEIAQYTNIKEFSQGIKEASFISEYENEVFGTSSYYVSGLLFEHWNLDTLYVDMLKGLDFEHDASTKLGYYIDTLDVVRTAINVKEVLTKESIDSAVEIVEDMKLDVDHFIKVASQMKKVHIKSGF